jgi:NADPH:quinone reductase-like Zn-dependent oxidoreductase
MRAVRLTGPVAPQELTVTEVPLPAVTAGQVRIRVRAFGINESEVTSRKGESGPDFSFPRILGIEAVGVVDAVGDGVNLVPGQKVATMMGASAAPSTAATPNTPSSTRRTRSPSKPTSGGTSLVRSQRCCKPPTGR